MKITYIEHSGFAVELKDVVLVFDYYKGKLPDFGKDRKIYVFASHGHFDHFQKDIFKWAFMYPDIKYILSDDIHVKEPSVNIIRMGSGEETEVDGMRIKTLRSTDEGVAFFVCVKGQTIYHAGDLNWWHWEEEGDIYNRFMEKSYKGSVKKIENARVDVAFVPLDPRLLEQYYWGLDWYMKHTDTRYVFPMHMQGRYELYEKLMAQPEALEYKEKVMHITKAGQIFEIKELA